jgi:hypothetical protein
MALVPSPADKGCAEPSVGEEVSKRVRNNDGYSYRSWKIIERSALLAARLVFFRSSFIRCGNNPWTLVSTGSVRPTYQAEHDAFSVMRLTLAARSEANQARLPRCTINVVATRD